MVGIENQTDIHYAMTVRNMLYDALNYTSQVNSCAKRHRNDKDVAGSEFLSGFTKDDKLLRFVPDYRLNLIVPDEIEDFDKFQTELGPVLEFISCADSGKEMKEALATRRKQWENLSEEAVELLNACVDAKIKINDSAEKGAGRNVYK